MPINLENVSKTVDVTIVPRPGWKYDHEIGIPFARVLDSDVLSELVTMGRNPGFKLIRADELYYMVTCPRQFAIDEVVAAIARCLEEDHGLKVEVEPKRT